MSVSMRALLFLMVFTFIGSGFWGPTGVQGKDKESLDSDRPIITTADTLELDNKNKTATFKGNVVAKQEQKGKEPFIIYCDKMVIYSSEESGKKPSPSQSKGNEKKNLNPTEPGGQDCGHRSGQGGPGKKCGHRRNSCFLLMPTSGSSCRVRLNSGRGRI